MWKLEEAGRCPRCGTFDWEWADPDSKHKDHEAYEGDIWKCYGCEELDWAREKIQNARTATHGLQTRLFPVSEGLMVSGD